MGRLAIRARLTVAFALAMVLVLAAAGLFIYLDLRGELDDSIEEALKARADAVMAVARRAGAGPYSLAIDRARKDTVEEGFAQILAADGRVLEGTEGGGPPALARADLQRATERAIKIDREVAGVEGKSRVLARPVAGAAGEAAVVAVGQSLDDRDEALSGLVTSFAIGGPIAVVMASLVGYGLATIGLAPVEAMRRRAAEVSLHEDDERLPLPVARDEVRRLGETLNYMLDRLQRSFERERRFVADASHELRTPIAVVKTELEGALNTGDYGEQVGAALAAAVEECDRLAQLAEDLLVIARASDGRLPVRAEPLDALDLLAGVRDRFVDRAAQQGRRIEVSVPEGLVFVADPLRLRQALGNLVDNALRHGAGDIALTARTATDHVVVEVGDGGSGFDEKVAPHAFERFTRGDESRTRGGAGLGLAIVEAVARSHGGGAAIVPGRGAAVRIELPHAAPPELTA